MASRVAPKRGRIAEIDRQLHADDRLDALFGDLFGKFQRAEEVIGVGDREGRLLVRPGELDASFAIVRAPSRSEKAV